MKRVATATMAGLVILLAGLVGFAPAQAADSCAVQEGDSGDPLQVTLCIEPAYQVVKERHDFSVKATAHANKPNFHCISITYIYQGKSNGSGKFTAPSVGEDLDTTVTATCTFDPLATLGGGGTGRLATVSLATAVTQPASAIVHVLDTKDGNGKKHHKKHKDGDDNGNLPNTGGERLAWLVIGLLLVAAGSTVVVSSRKRDSVA